ncbi:DUF5805 domain-containing protein [Halocatena pleomorpha]|uniref:Uncharacterized protein n=1 Tax=Halocatena pleomorpha TaxID=1785090 RepID=A0A3P3R463_9EURY|nr:DUF5805 domain-containing protein [Halocatena pleomorpha]RRJ28145.1 hypothetical protein EIK79_16250 [Halocatena pleomorpha]
MVEDDDTVSIKVHMPQWQKKRWVANADQLDMSQSEFVRSMVQAGRRGFWESSEPPEAGSSDATPRGNDLETRVLDVLRNSDRDYLDWEELLAGVTDDIEEQLEATLDSLQETNQVKYSGRNGGYTIQDERTN